MSTTSHESARHCAALAGRAHGNERARGAPFVFLHGLTFDRHTSLHEHQPQHLPRGRGSGTGNDPRRLEAPHASSVPQRLGIESAGFGACAGAWPPLRATGKPTVGGGADASLLGSTTRSDGEQPLTYSGHPLYLYAGDERADDTRGHMAGLADEIAEVSAARVGAAVTEIATLRAALSGPQAG